MRSGQSRVRWVTTHRENHDEGFLSSNNRSTIFLADNAFTLQIVTKEALVVRGRSGDLGISKVANWDMTEMQILFIGMIG